MNSCLKRVLVASLLLVASLPVAASTFRLLELPEMIAAAEVAIHGIVRSNDSVLLDGEPWTRVTFEVVTVLADAEEARIEEGLLSLDFLGGSASGIQLSVALMPQFTAGDEVLLLAYDEPYYSPVVGFNQGLWLLAEDGAWRDVSGESLGLDEDGELQPGTTGDALEIVTALQQRLEDR